MIAARPLLSGFRKRPQRRSPPDAAAQDPNILMDYWPAPVSSAACHRVAQVIPSAWMWGSFVIPLIPMPENRGRPRRAADRIGLDDLSGDAVAHQAAVPPCRRRDRHRPPAHDTLRGPAPARGAAERHIETSDASWVTTGTSVLDRRCRPVAKRMSDCLIPSLAMRRPVPLRRFASAGGE
jgi:hypothetical protein